ncbi:AAA family ATPase [Polynucleobacter sp. HIN8]|uniref:AAA family ATPase n=1 Tax=Polynucleobacter sp. HIN8 TaxID=3047867 RepID=UPI002572F382|nr:AAA family ATPase [Polynucleobacter sp. HIN8]BEI38617.1 AAA family ATPase [Polynucleobacter sp. HIN8]
MNKAVKELNIGVIASTNEVIKSLEQVFSKNANIDNLVYLKRIDNELRLNRIDTAKTDILIVDSIAIAQSDLDDLSLLNQEKSHPAMIYLASNWTEQHLIDLMRSGVQDIVHLPLNGSSQDLLDAVERIRQKTEIAKRSKAKGKIISVMPCKGGAGATFICVNLAYQLAEKYNQRVLLIDLHTQYGDAAYYLTDSLAAGNVADVVTQPYLNSVTIASAAMQVAENYYLLPAANSIEKSAKIQSHQIDTLLTVAASEYDYVLLDLSSSLDVLSTRGIDRSDYVYLVTQPTLNFLKALINTLNLFKELDYPNSQIRLVMNQFDMDAALSGEKITQLLSRDVDNQIPYDGAAVDESINAGIPIVKMNPTNRVSLAIDEMTNILLERKVTAKTESFITKILPFKLG